MDRLDADAGEPGLCRLTAARANRAQASLSARKRQDRDLQRRAAGCGKAAPGLLEPLRGEAMILTGSLGISDCRPREGGDPYPPSFRLLAGLATSRAPGVWAPAFAGTTGWQI